MPSPTVQSSLSSGVAVIATCRACHHTATLDLHDLAARGFGQSDLSSLPLRCACGCRDYGVTVMDAEAARIRPAK